MYIIIKFPWQRMFCEWVLSSIAATYSFIEQQLLINLSYEYEVFLEGEGEWWRGLYLDVTVYHFIFEVLEQGNKPTNPGNIGKYSNEIR